MLCKGGTINFLFLDQRFEATFLIIKITSLFFINDDRSPLFIDFGIIIFLIVFQLAINSMKSTTTCSSYYIFKPMLIPIHQFKQRNGIPKKLSATEIVIHLSNWFFLLKAVGPVSSLVCSFRNSENLPPNRRNDIKA